MNMRHDQPSLPNGIQPSPPRIAAGVVTRDGNRIFGERRVLDRRDVTSDGHDCFRNAVFANGFRWNRLNSFTLSTNFLIVSNQR